EFPQIPHLSLGQCQFAGFGHNREGIVENLRASQLDDPVRHIFHIDAGRFRKDLREMLVRARVIVRPSRAAELSPSRVFPARDDELRRGRLVLKKETPKTLAIEERSAGQDERYE